MASRLRLARVLTSGFLALVLPILLTSLVQAQAPQPVLPSVHPEDPVHTLHVYMDLIQVPVLVLDSEMERMKPLDASRFLISLDSGPVFHPRNVRPEGDDPISLSILLDAQAEPILMPKISAAIGSLAPEYLHPGDRVKVYVLDCALTRTVLNVPANPELLKDAVDRTLANWTQRRQARHAPACPRKIQLWDAMGYLIKELSDVPGRRVMLVVTDGADHGSLNKWNDVRLFAQQNGVAIFGFSTPGIGNASSRIGTVSSSVRPSRSSGFIPTVGSANSSEDPFNAICQLSGGMVMAADDRYLARDLQRFATLVRERYIVEFVRARNDTPGQHSILVTIDKSPNAYVRPTGVIITMRDPAVEADPNTIPRDDTNAPELGKRKPIR